MSVCLSVCLSVQAINFELFHIETSFLVCRYIFTISRLRSRSYEKMKNFTYFNMLILCIWLQVFNKVKFIYKAEGHIKVKVKYLHPFKFYVACTKTAGEWFPFDRMRSCSNLILFNDSKYISHSIDSMYKLQSKRLVTTSVSLLSQTESARVICLIDY